MSCWRPMPGRLARRAEAPTSNPASRATAAIQKARAAVAALAVGLAALGWSALAAGADGAGLPAIFRGADLPLGERLLAEHRCSECHSRRVGGDGSDIYNPAGRIATPAALRGMVEYCNTDLGLQMFPEEVTAIAAVLNRDHYRFR